MAKYSPLKKDKINSTYYIIIYFFKENKIDTEKVPLYSKYEGQPERKDAFTYWRERIHYLRTTAKYGMNVGDIYNNKDKDPHKKPILRIHGSGKEEWNPKDVHSSTIPA